MLRSLLNKPNRLLCARIYSEGIHSFDRCTQTLHFRPPVCRIPQQNFSSKVESNQSKADTQPIVVYVGEYTSRVHRVKTFSFCSSILGIGAQPILMRKLESLGELILANTFLGFFAFVTPLLLHYITKRYVTKVVYDPVSDTYTASFISFFLFEKKLTFGPGEAEVPDLPTMFTSFKVKGVPLLVDSHDFNITHYTRILGYDKPLDFKLPKEDVVTDDVTPENATEKSKKN